MDPLAEADALAGGVLDLDEPPAIRAGAAIEHDIDVISLRHECLRSMSA